MPDTDELTIQLAVARAERDALVEAITAYREMLDDNPALIWNGALVSSDLAILVKDAADEAAKRVHGSPLRGDTRTAGVKVGPLHVEGLTLDGLKAAANRLPGLVEKYGIAVAIGVGAVKKEVRK